MLHVLHVLLPPGYDRQVDITCGPPFISHILAEKEYGLLIEIYNKITKIFPP